jgi:4'-phosphopantetheinyl transferase
VTELLSGIDLQIYIACSECVVPDSFEQACLDVMPPGIRASILRYNRWQDRQATLFGKLLLLRALRIKFQDAGIQQFHLLDVTRFGKPFIPGGPDFNISHSEDMIVLAVIQSGAVGIDIEKIRPVNLQDFSQDLPEIANLQEKYDADDVNSLFFDCWTQKEAVLKGYGKGLLAPLEQVAIKEGAACFRESTWFIRKLFIKEGYCCHVATDKILNHVVVEHVDLMNGDFFKTPSSPIGIY